MKKLFLILIILTSVGVSQNFNVNINLKDGSTVTFSIEDIQKIEFGNLTGIENGDKPHQLVQTFKLLQNYPNPFNPSTTIAYQLPKTSAINVSIFDINGKLVKEILNETQNEGHHEVTWDGANQQNNRVASGIYIYTVKSGDVILSKQMILIK